MGASPTQPLCTVACRDLGSMGPHPVLFFQVKPELQIHVSSPLIVKDNTLKFLRNTGQANAKKVLTNHGCRLCSTHGPPV